MKFNEKFNAFVGLNGQGKTNLLDAIYYLSMAKSNFTAMDRDVVQFEQSFFRVEGIYDQDEKIKSKVVMKVQPYKSKEIEVNNKKLSKRSEHIGLIPIVVVTPDDLVELLSTSESRRKFLDSSLIQYDKEYLNNLIAYNRLLKQRNALLKQMAENRTWNETLVKVLDEKMSAPAGFIFNRRLAEAKELTPVFEKIYGELSQKAENCKIEYESELAENDFIELMAKARQKDQILRRTSSGIHKDDIYFSINDKKLKKFGSQGQLKSFVFALKLAQYHFLKTKKEIKPILLLDDIFDKLDNKRVASLIKIIANDEYGQIFISNTSEKMIREIFESMNLNYSIFHLNKGALIE